MPDPMSALMDAVVDNIAARRRFPESTYRLQFHAGFTFRDALRIVPYLHALGITHGYASPFLQAQPGSTHGYDITNHQAFNPEIGTEADYDALCEAFEAHGMGQVLDIVPNHMGVAGNDNQWWHDVLENGSASPYAGFFDIAWYASPRLEMHGKVVLPDPGEVLRRGARVPGDPPGIRRRHIDRAVLRPLLSSHPAHLRHDPGVPTGGARLPAGRRDGGVRGIREHPHRHRPPAAPQ